MALLIDRWGRGDGRHEIDVWNLVFKIGLPTRYHHIEGIYSHLQY